MATKSIITITDNGTGSLDVKLEFEPAAKTEGPMTIDQHAAFTGLKAIQDWASAAGGVEDGNDATQE